MKIEETLLILFLIIMIIRQLKIKKEILIPISTSNTENIIFLLIISFFIGMIYFGAKTLTHYLIGILAIIMFITMWIKSGITKEGFSSMKRGVGIIKWDQISGIRILVKKDIKITLRGKFMEETFSFDKEEYNKIMEIIKEKLPGKTELVIR